MTVDTTKQPRLSLAQVGLPVQSDDFGIVHLGIGAFHRAHQAVFTQEALEHEGAEKGGNWHIVGVSLRSATVRDQLNPQDGLYTVVETASGSSKTKVISAVKNVLVAPENPKAVLDLLQDDRCKIISLTVTEKGYCHLPATGSLDLKHPDIEHDLKNPESPKSAIAYLAYALAGRKASGNCVPTVLCCDNLPHNGSTLRKIVLEFAALLDQELADWIQANVAFPNTMVDRIVPATQQEDIDELAQSAGYYDFGMVKTEAFKQWVIEDQFTSGRPQWEAAGAMLVEDVAPFENAKLRLLNGAHSSLAYLGYLRGYEYVHQVMQDADFCKYLEALMLENIVPTLAAPEGLDLKAYSRSLLARFENSALNHRTYQIAMDGSQKLPQRLLHTITERLAAGEKIDYLVLAVAAWIRYSLGFDEKGEAIEVQDPLANDFKAIEKRHYNATENMHDLPSILDDYLKIDAVFDADLAAHPIFRERLAYWLSQLLANGVATTMKIMLIEGK